eukprot:CAMPEP_0168557520 /NCGR_PEP_ID=MMETSP0413-20121227/9470_1 /TAXON_ID=136452 /ORGANISM="Filamoeba nolandi, Strain NC-AS-23-1" /LENGTH=461 /DNA_ID=CAMNT_0008588559 /DNA_START=24 /DNA_END=1409 /DNA_ORIENTATION=+
MAAVEPTNLALQAVATIPKVTDCVGWDDHIATGHGNSFIKLWKYDPSTKKLDFVLRFRHLSDTEKVEVFNEDAEEAPAKKKSLQEPVTNMMLFHMDPQEKPSNLLDGFDEGETNPVYHQLKEILSAKTQTPSTFLCNFVGSNLQLWNKKGEGMFSDLPVDETALVADYLFVEPMEGEGEICSETLLFGAPDSMDAIDATHAFGFFAAERARQLWITTEEGLKVVSRKDFFTNPQEWSIPSKTKFGWSYPSLCEWHQMVVVSGWEHGVHIWDPIKFSLNSTIPEYSKDNPASKVFTWRGYLGVSVSAKGNDRIDFWQWKDGQITKVGSWHLTGGNSDMDAKFFEWRGFLCAFQYKTLTLYECDLPAVPETKLEVKPQLYEKYKQEGENINNNNSKKKKKKSAKRKRPRNESIKQQVKKKNPKTVDKWDDEDEFDDEYQDEEEEPEAEPESSEYEEEEAEDSD